MDVLRDIGTLIGFDWLVCKLFGNLACLVQYGLDYQRIKDLEEMEGGMLRRFLDRRYTTGGVWIGYLDR